MCFRHKCRSVLALLLAFGSALPVAAATLDLNSTIATGVIGQNFSVDIVVSDIADLYSFQFDIGYNPAVLAATAISEGAFLGNVGATLFIPGSIDNNAGSIAAIADALNGAVTGVSGSGLFTKIDFTIVGTGNSAINLFNEIFLDSTLTDISVSPIHSANIIVNDNISNVPLPGAMSLFSIAVSLVMLSSWRRSV